MKQIDTNYEKNCQTIRSRLTESGASVGGIKVNPEWFASLLPDDNEIYHLRRLDRRIAGAIHVGIKRAAKNCKTNTPVGIRFQLLLMLIAIRDGVLEVAINLMHNRNDDRQFGFQVVYKNGLAKFQLLEIVE